MLFEGSYVKYTYVTPKSSKTAALTDKRNGIFFQIVYKMNTKNNSVGAQKTTPGTSKIKIDENRIHKAAYTVSISSFCRMRFKPFNPPANDRFHVIISAVRMQDKIARFSLPSALQETAPQPEQA